MQKRYPNQLSFVLVYLELLLTTAGEPDAPEEEDELLEELKEIFGPYVLDKKMTTVDSRRYGDSHF